MKIVSNLVISCVLVFSIVSCKDCAPNIDQKQDLSNTDFIYIDGNKFALKNEPYFAMMLNYVLDTRSIDGEFIISPYIGYETPAVYETNTKADIENQLRGHFQLIKEMGFNTVRLCFDRITIRKDKYCYSANGVNYFIEEDYFAILEALKTAIDIAGEKELRVMLLLKNPSAHPSLENFAVRIMQAFKENPTIFAYDLFNEPLYFDPVEHTKTEVCAIVSHWKSLMNEHAPNQLLTIGFSEPIETFKWDPSILPVDFIAFHTYHPLRVKSEVYWYSTYVNKPWMIGETAMPADNDSISYEEQRAFMLDLYKYVLDCGGTGFGWWEFQESTGGNFEAKYTGLLTHEGTTTTQDNKHTIIGTQKPTVEAFMNIEPYTPQKKVRPVNYYNIVGYNNFVVRGKIVNKWTRRPIEGATIRGWTDTWVGMNTFSDKNGEFTLYSNAEAVHFQISAPGMDQIGRAHV